MSLLQSYDKTNQTISQANTDKSLKNEKFDWNGKKKKTLELADIYRDISYSDYQRRAVQCGSFLEFNLLEADRKSLSEALKGKKQLSSANFCQLRLCPVCNARRSAKLASMLVKALKCVKADHEDARLLFLTLTMKNCTADELCDSITHLFKSWDRLTKRRAVKRVVKGFFRSLEITHDYHRNTYHPHLHCLLIVTEDYFLPNNPDYIVFETWREYWKQCLKVDYNPMINIKAAKNNAKAVSEVAKYSVKDDEFLDIAKNKSKKRAREVVKAYTSALYKRRAIQCGGWLKEYWNELEEEDLLHISDDGEAHTKWYAQYNYGYGSISEYQLKRIVEMDKSDWKNIKIESTIEVCDNAPDL